VAPRALVIGGTGPTGIWIVQGLVDRGWHVTILHRGTHERPETPAEVEHLHHDPYDADDLRAGLEGRTFDLCVAMYGRLRRIAEIMSGQVGQFVSVGGVPAIRGWMNPFLFEPNGLPVPADEHQALVADESEDAKGYRVARTEEVVFEHHPRAAHFRYPYAYGPYQVVPREWSVVRRVLDGRRRIIVPDDGLTLHHHGFTRNLAHAVLLGIEQPDAAAGKVFNAADEEVLSIRQVIELIAAELDHSLEIVSMPYDLAVPAWPLMAQPLPTHRVLDLTRLKSDLGYHDLVPAREAVGITARWLADNPLKPGDTEEIVLTDPFDYAAEDTLIDAWQAARAAIPAFTPTSEATPRYGLAYSGPGGRPRTRARFE
jgi:nucleoside-diphosphate-sugar epimerase